MEAVVWPLVKVKVGIKQICFFLGLLVYLHSILPHVYIWSTKITYLKYLLLFYLELISVFLRVKPYSKTFQCLGYVHQTNGKIIVEGFPHWQSFGWSV